MSRFRLSRNGVGSVEKNNLRAATRLQDKFLHTKDSDVLREKKSAKKRAQNTRRTPFPIQSACYFAFFLGVFPTLLMQQDRFRERQQLIFILKFSMHCAAAEAISCSEQKDFSQRESTHLLLNSLLLHH
jgi:hypothetical protein